MIGPKPKNSWREVWKNSEETFLGLVRGRRYRVIRPFVDFDGDEHREGESWIYLGRNFLPYEDGLSLFVSLDGDQEWHIRMRWTPEDQEPIIDLLHEYVVPTDDLKSMGPTQVNLELPA